MKLGAVFPNLPLYSKKSANFADFHRGTPGTGVIYRMKVPNGGWRAPTVSQEQGCLSRGGI